MKKTFLTFATLLAFGIASAQTDTTGTGTRRTTPQAGTSTSTDTGGETTSQGTTHSQKKAIKNKKRSNQGANATSPSNDTRNRKGSTTTGSGTTGNGTTGNGSNTTGSGKSNTGKQN